MTTKRRVVIACITAISLSCGSVPLQGQATGDSFAAYLKENAKSLTVTEGQLQGPGAAWLQSEARGAQFFLIGEEHGLAELEVLTGALWRLLVPLGYRHLAVEEGTWSMSLVNRYVGRGDDEALATYLAAVLRGSPPASVEHLALIRGLRDAVRPRAANIVWGLDQERRAVPMLSRLTALARTPAGRDAVEQALNEATRREGGGQLLLDGYSREIQALRRAFPDRLPAEADWLLTLMEQSNRIYDDGSAPPAERRGFASIEAREELMKDNFLAAYRVAEGAGERRPRVLLRVGQWHGMRGLSPTQVPTLGNFLSEFGRAQGGRLFNMAVTCATGERSSGFRALGRAEPCGSDGQPWFNSVLGALAGPVTVFDLRPLRAAHHAGAVNVPAEVVPYVYSYDALLVISTSSRLHFPDLPAR